MNKTNIRNTEEDTRLNSITKNPPCKMTMYHKTKECR